MASIAQARIQTMAKSWREDYEVMISKIRSRDIIILQCKTYLSR